jgi:hypothetical protein
MIRHSDPHHPQIKETAMQMRRFLAVMVGVMALAGSHGQADAWTITARGTIYQGGNGADYKDHAGLFWAFGAPLIGLSYSATITTDP